MVKQWRYKTFILALILLLFSLLGICACSKDNGSVYTIDGDGAKVSLETGDFYITCSMPQYVYSGYVPYQEPFRLEVMIEYLGEHDIAIQHPFTFSSVALRTPSGKMFAQLWSEAGVTTILRPDTAAVEIWKGKGIFTHQREIEKGEYTAFISVKFSVAEDSTEKYDLKFELPFRVE